MTIRMFAAVLALGMAVSSCADDKILDVPQFPGGGVLDQTYPVPDAAKAQLTGVYNVLQGADQFGPTMVVKWCGNGISMFSGQQVGHFVLQVGEIDSVILMEGYWRYAVSNQTGLARFGIKREEGGRFLMGDSSGSRFIRITGTIGDGQEAPSRPVVLEYSRPIRQDLLEKNFLVIAHRAGGRTSDRIPASENTVEMVRLAETFGSTGIEIDVRLTKDGVPILYHDNSINPRLTRKTALVGGVEDYTFAQVRSAIRLIINWEKIPTLEEVLQTVVDETTLRFVYLDSKTEGRNLVELVAPIQQKYLARAQAAGRQLEIMIGIPTEDILNEVLKYPGYEQLPTLCELSTDDTRKVGAEFWAPRWTQGTLDADVAAMKSEGRRVVVWTLDVQSYINQFIARGTFDGILTNYPTAVAYAYYIQ
jgi:glycerophosphoryl diester phosphodiesterase